VADDPETRGDQGLASSARGPDTPKACPSALCEENALLLGVVTSAGTVAFVQPPTRIGAAFVERARAMGHPERRFRFSNTCSEGGCPQWTGKGCAVVDHAIQMAASGLSTKEQSSAPAGLPACVIRRSCRWYAQRGASACAVCPTVIADTGGIATYQSTQPAMTLSERSGS
jgi:hypothetical protein